MLAVRACRRRLVAVQPVPLDEPKAVVKQVAIATQLLHGIGLQGASYDTWRNAAGMALLGVMRRYNHGLDRLPVIQQTSAINGGKILCSDDFGWSLGS